MHIPDWLVEVLGVIMNGLALIILAVSASVSAPREILPSRQAGKKINLVKVAPRKHKLHVVFMCILLISVPCSFLFQLISAYHHHAFDTNLARYFEDSRFENSRMIQHRKYAAASIKEYLSSTNKNWTTLTNDTDDLDYVLGFFDELGYDLEHGRISADVIHEYFYADAVAYYQGARQYIAYSQRTDSKEDFSHIKPLVDAIMEIESKKTGQSASALIWSNKDLADYFRSEITLKSDK